MDQWALVPPIFHLVKQEYILEQQLYVAYMEARSLISLVRSVDQEDLYVRYYTWGASPTQEFDLDAILDFEGLPRWREW